MDLQKIHAALREAAELIGGIRSGTVYLPDAPQLGTAEVQLLTAAESISTRADGPKPMERKLEKARAGSRERQGLVDKLNQRIRELHARASGQFHHWIVGDDNGLGSLCCPILIDANALRDLLIEKGSGSMERRLRGALDSAIGHSNCYCNECNALSNEFLDIARSMEAQGENGGHV